MINFPIRTGRPSASPFVRHNCCELHQINVKLTQSSGVAFTNPFLALFIFIFASNVSAICLLCCKTKDMDTEILVLELATDEEQMEFEEIRYDTTVGSIVSCFFSCCFTYLASV
jgi:hypothetical protein